MPTGDAVPPSPGQEQVSPVRTPVAVAAGALGLIGTLLWPVLLWGDYDPREYLALLVGNAAMAITATVMLTARPARGLASAVLAGGLPVSALGAWWLVGDSWLTDWPAPVSSALLVAASLLAAFSRRDAAMVSGNRRTAFGLAAAGLLAAVAGLWTSPGAFAAVLALVVMALPMIVAFGVMAGRRLGTALATASLMLATHVVQTAFADQFFTPGQLLWVAAVVLLGAASVTATLNPAVRYRQVIPAMPAVLAAVAAIAMAAGSVVLTATAAAADEGPGAPAVVPSSTSSPGRTPSASPSSSPSSAPTPAPTTPPVAPYPGQKPVPATTAGIGGPCDLTAPRIICIDKTARKLYFIDDGRLLLTLDARFGGEANPTREGEWTVYRKDADHVSTGYGSQMPYAMFFSEGEAIHYSIDFATRGYEGHSHGCVNIRDEVALAWLFDRVPVGTPVTIWS